MGLWQSDERFEEAVAILESFIKDYATMSVWRDLIAKIQGQLHALGRDTTNPPPFGLKEAIKVLIAQYGAEAITHEMLED
jgi:hypothetical protein